MNNINERLDNLKLEIQKPEFLEGKGLSNEVNIRIFCYDAQDEMIVRHFTENEPRGEIVIIVSGLKEKREKDV